MKAKRQKRWWTSRTLFVSVVSLTATALGVAGIDVLESPVVQAQAVAALTAIAGFAVRFVTTEPVDDRLKSKERSSGD